MNQSAVIFHLKEAKEELDRTIAQVENDTSYDSAKLQVAMSHLYHHLNTAWNGRDASVERHNQSVQSDFDAWRKFPPNADLLLDCPRYRQADETNRHWGSDFAVS